MPGSETEARLDGGAPLPRWDLSPIYPSLDSPEFESAKARLSAISAELLSHIGASGGGDSRGTSFADWLVEALRLEDEAGALSETLYSYAYTVFSTATGDARAMAQINALEASRLPVKRAQVLFREALASRRAELEGLLEAPGADPRLESFAFHLREELFLQSRQMAPELEDLAADLQRSGGDAWGRLQETMTASASAVLEGGERKTLVELRSLAYDSDRSVREKAYRAELALCESIEIPVAAALNGVKGFSVSLGARRGWESCLEASIAQARVTRKTLEALIGAMEESLPSWRRYLKAKARLLGLDRLAFYDLFAPTGDEGRRYGFTQARDFIVDRFASFDPEMGEFASRAFAEGWIDAEPRPGKVGGAYCAAFPAAETSRVLCNFDGSFNSVVTVAHELGHAWHGERLRGQRFVHRQYPMTLAETASIFAETIVYEAALAQASAARAAGTEAGSGPGRAALLELRLQDACQVIVDILSRFYFERRVFERRASSELAPAEFCELMTEAQRLSYGDGLDPARLHPYMWLVKGHYYSPDLAFYNFPYAFGQLFGAALYARYEAEGPAFVPAYRGILEGTGRASAVDVAAAAGCDIESPDFWRSGLAFFARLVGDLEAIATSSPSLVV